jgi:hypothetical protein
METSPEKTEQKQMSDLAIARSLFIKINNGDALNIKGMLNRVYKFVKDAHEKRADENERRRPWTHRKLRGIWEGKAIVKYHEMLELADAVEAAAQETKLQEAREAHAEFIAQNCRITAMLSTVDEAFHSHEIERLRGVIRGVDSAGNNRDKQDQ